MIKIILPIACFLFPVIIHGQTTAQKLQKAYSIFEKDSQLKYAISSIYVIDANTGKVVIDRNSRIGLAPASTQKIITSVSAFEILGKTFEYSTDFYVFGSQHNWSIAINPTGDPTLGSWRWKNTSTDSILGRLVRKFATQSKNFSGPLLINDHEWNSETIPGGWIWEDIGNYYGAGASSFNWRENQYDILLSSGNSIGDSVYVVSTIPQLGNKSFISYATAAAAGTGDNAYIYYDPLTINRVIIRGTIPVGQKRFSISGSVVSGIDYFSSMLADTLKINQPLRSVKLTPTDQLRKIHTEVSPPLDSIIYYFNQRSINLYGEALVKTISYKTYKLASTDSGVSVIKNFWKRNGLDPNELNIHDGSGLSPQNRVTTHAQVEILKFARKQDWFHSFYHSIPVFNTNMKLKSGTINRVKAFAGYHKAINGKEYIISFIVNNYNGSASALVNKMYKVLDVLK